MSVWSFIGTIFGFVAGFLVSKGIPSLDSKPWIALLFAVSALLVTMFRSFEWIQRAKASRKISYKGDIAGIKFQFAQIGVQAAVFASLGIGALIGTRSALNLMTLPALGIALGLVFGRLIGMKTRLRNSKEGTDPI